MDEQYRYPYLDSSAFIAWIKNEVIGGVQRKPIIDHILRLAARGTFRIGTSTLTLVEVHKMRTGPVLAPHEDERILAFFEHDYFDIVRVERDIAEHANRLCGQYNILPHDAIHRASALPLGRDVLRA